MGYLIAVLIPLALLVGLFVLTEYEARRGTRFFAPHRARLDKNIERYEFIMTHVDFNSFLREEARRIMHAVAHAVAHLSLQAVRTAERFLTHVVRYLRARRAIDVTPRENAREFVKTLSDFKGHLEANRPEVPDVLS